MKKSLLSFDYHFQLITFLLIMISSVTIFPLLLLVPFGAYQVLSAGLKGISMDRYAYRVFALLAGIYGLALTYIAFGGNDQLRDVLDLLDGDLIKIVGFFAYILIPVTSAIYYISESYKDWQNAIETEELSELVS